MSRNRVRQTSSMRHRFLHVGSPYYLLRSKTVMPAIPLFLPWTACIRGTGQSLPSGVIRWIQPAWRLIACHHHFRFHLENLRLLTTPMRSCEHHLIRRSAKWLAQRSSIRVNIRGIRAPSLPLGWTPLMTLEVLLHRPFIPGIRLSGFTGSTCKQ
jgi:hypothetical protein